MTNSPQNQVDSTGQSNKRKPFRADIQALRAIAVLLVVLNHIWPMRLSGGFVGVDVFFVISGFLITAHLLSELRRTNTVSLPKFYARRARRLLPAALLVGALTLVATLIWIPAERWSRIAKEIFASAAYFENWLLTASSVNYSDRGQAATPAQHYWSLSVEEQFYLLWPLTLVVLSTLLARRILGLRTERSKAILLAITIFAVLSFAFSVWQTDANRAAAYFNTFGRVWEFMIGAGIAVVAPAIAGWYQRRPVATLRGIAQLAGYAMIFWSALRFNDATAFPGPWALLPVAGTALVIVAGPETPRWSPAKLLAWKPVQYVGDISYSLYLWHWPVIVIVPFALAREVRLVDRLGMLALSFLLAALTKHFVEDPGRTKLFAQARPRRTLLATLASVGVVAALSAGAIAGAGVIHARETARIEAAIGSGCFGAAALKSGNTCEDPFGPALFPAGAESEAPWRASAPECQTAPEDRQILANGKPSYVECNFKNDASISDPYRVWLIGDSHAEHWRAPIFDIARANEWELHTTMQGGCPSVPVPMVQAFGAETTEAKQNACLEWIEEASARVLKNEPDLVIVSNFASTEVVEDGSGRPQSEQLADGMAVSLKAWSDAGARVVVIRDVPTAGEKLGADCVLLMGEKPRGCVAPQSEVLHVDPMVEALALVADPQITSIDLTRYFCLDNECSGVIGAVPVFYDADHVSASFARSLAPILQRELSVTLSIDLSEPVAAEM
ncbi:acyltransferase family protein [Leucobacter denitrificans]|uniref:Acyltransferase n=1 Tax=Leucobacter denitrificans TaxID=683042 RepID=A0A7G9S3L3_9MICO|nr:acyltransferase family protein [Leucobacter denitrificans]QNN62438.1 acyltransferase [Leucobacter denitrificans]